MKPTKRNRFTLASLMLFAAFAAVVPLCRAFFLEEVSYNEGWNVYNAQTVVQGGPLYPVRYGWTSVNYPMLSFWLMAQMHRFTHEYLFTARAVSLLALLVCAWLVAMMVHSVGGSGWAALLAGLFCWTVFCAATPFYVGVDDPQMLAQAFIVFGLLLYVRGPRSFGRMSLVALVFVVGLFVKHNQVDIALAVFVDLLFVSGPLALWFGACGLGFGAAGAMLCVRYGGPFFFAQLLSPRSYSWGKAGLQVVDVVGPLTIVFAAVAYTAWRGRRDPRRRIFLLLLLTSLLVSGYFSGGRGVSANALFSVLLAISVWVGLLLDDVRVGRMPAWMQSLAPYAPWLCFGWLLIPIARSGEWNPVARLREAREAQRKFQEDVAVLRSMPGPALCESLLECDEAGKPYVYDPFNATRLVKFGKLDVEDVVRALRDGKIGAVQTDGALEHANAQQDERFAREIETAVEVYYVPVHQRAPDPALDWGPAQESVIYAPRSVGR